MKKASLVFSLCIATIATLSACVAGKSVQTTKISESISSADGTYQIADATTTISAQETKTSPLENFHQILVDNESALVEISSIKPDDLWGYTLKVHLENHTDKTLMFAISDASVNGVMIDPFWATSIEPNKKKNDEISWSKSSLRDNGIDEVSSVELAFRIYDDDDWLAEALVDETFIIYPLGVDNAQTTSLQSTGREIILFDTDDCSMIVTDFDPDGSWGYTMNVFLENKMDKKLMFSISDASINGYMVDPFWAEEVMPGKVSFEEIAWSNTALEENGIEEIKEIEIKVRVHDIDDWFGEDIIADTFIITP